MLPKECVSAWAGPIVRTGVGSAQLAETGLLFRSLGVVEVVDREPLGFQPEPSGAWSAEDTDGVVDRLVFGTAAGLDAALPPTRLAPTHISGILSPPAGVWPQTDAMPATITRQVSVVAADARSARAGSALITPAPIVSSEWTTLSAAAFRARGRGRAARSCRWKTFTNVSTGAIMALKPNLRVGASAGNFAGYNMAPCSFCRAFHEALEAPHRRCGHHRPHGPRLPPALNSARGQ